MRTLGAWDLRSWQKKIPAQRCSGSQRTRSRCSCGTCGPPMDQSPRRSTTPRPARSWLTACRTCWPGSISARACEPCRSSSRADAVPRRSVGLRLSRFASPRIVGIHGGTGRHNFRERTERNRAARIEPERRHHPEGCLGPRSTQVAGRGGNDGSGPRSGARHVVLRVGAVQVRLLSGTAAAGGNRDTGDLWLADSRSSDVLWIDLVSIESLGEREVFDATVEPHHNFVANGAIAHNSLEQDADVVMFMNRDEEYHPETPDKRGWRRSSSPSIARARPARCDWCSAVSSPSSATLPEASDQRSAADRADERVEHTHVAVRHDLAAVGSPVSWPLPARRRRASRPRCSTCPT